MNYVVCVRGEGPISERVFTTENYAEFCQRASEIAKKYLSPIRARAIITSLGVFKQGGIIRMDAFIMEGRE